SDGFSTSPLTLSLPFYPHRVAFSPPPNEKKEYNPLLFHYDASTYAMIPNSINLESYKQSMTTVDSAYAIPPALKILCDKENSRIHLLNAAFPHGELLMKGETSSHYLRNPTENESGSVASLRSSLSLTMDTYRREASLSLLPGNTLPEEGDSFPPLTVEGISPSHEFSGISHALMDTEIDKELASLFHCYRNLINEKQHICTTLLEKIHSEPRVDWKLCAEVEKEMLKLYIREHEEESLDTRHTYTLTKQCVDLQRLRITCTTSRNLPDEWAERALCTICGSGDDWDEDPIMFCDGCYRPMHFCCLGYPLGHYREIMEEYTKERTKWKRESLKQFPESFETPQTSEDNPTLPLPSSTSTRPVGGAGGFVCQESEEDWLCPLCVWVRRQLPFITEEEVALNVIRKIAGPRTLASYQRLLESYSGWKTEHVENLETLKTRGTLPILRAIERTAVVARCGGHLPRRVKVSEAAEAAIRAEGEALSSPPLQKTIEGSSETFFSASLLPSSSVEISPILSSPQKPVYQKESMRKWMQYLNSLSLLKQKHSRERSRHRKKSNPSNPPHHQTSRKTFACLSKKQRQDYPSKREKSRRAKNGKNKRIYKKLKKKNGMQKKGMSHPGLSSTQRLASWSQ
ncbi:PHD-finger domain-containing protein, partial [Cardiosporidium cionae]